jgi:hypothetical protein
VHIPDQVEGAVKWTTVEERPFLCLDFHAGHCSNRAPPVKPSAFCRACTRAPPAL